MVDIRVSMQYLLVSELIWVTLEADTSSKSSCMEKSRSMAAVGAKSGSNSESILAFQEFGSPLQLNPCFIPCGCLIGA